MNVFGYLRRVFRYLRPYSTLAIEAVAATVCLVAAGLLVPWPIKILVDSVLGDAPFPPAIQALLPGEPDKITMLVVTVGAGFVIALLAGVLNVLATYLKTKLEIALTLDFRSDLFQQAQRLSMAYHDQRRSAMVIYIINSLAGAAGTVMMSGLPFAQNALTLIGMIWVSYRLNPTLALLSLSIVPFLYYSVGYYNQHIRQRLLHVKGMEGETLSIIHEAVSMLRVIVAFGREDYEHARFREQGQRALDARVDITLRQTVFSLAVNATTAIGTASVLGYGAYLVLQQQLTVGQLLVIVAYIGSVYKPLEAISGTIGALQDQLVNLQIAFDLLDKEPDIKDTPGAVTIGHARGQVRFDHVSFRYEGRDATLTDICLDAGPGDSVAIVGATGAGKSTLVSLLPRFYEPGEGCIRLDGRDIRTLTLSSLRRQISIVLQEPLLFSASIADNIRYGRLDATMDEVIAAARAANADDFVSALPLGYDTLLGERGAQLSGGERQRIAVARAFLKNAPILILDEPTSSIDSKTEAVILDALDRLMVGRTTFLVAHRLSTLRSVSKIVVLDQGRIVEQGTHVELVQRDGVYRQLYEIQAGQTGRLEAVPAGSI
jgi:ATP-binding cassette, subfamily B, bacterial